MLPGYLCLYLLKYNISYGILHLWHTYVNDMSFLKSKFFVVFLLLLGLQLVVHLFLQVQHIYYGHAKSNINSIKDNISTNKSGKRPLVEYQFVTNAMSKANNQGSKDVVHMTMWENDTNGVIQNLTERVLISNGEMDMESNLEKRKLISEIDQGEGKVGTTTNKTQFIFYSQDTRMNTTSYTFPGLFPNVVHDFDWSPTQIPEIVAGWRKHTNDMGWNPVDILNIPQLNFDPHLKNPCYVQQEYIKCLPYFMVIGTAKSGTTDLFATISKHKYVIPPERKEQMWWNRERLLGVSLQEYMDRFDVMFTKGLAGSMSIEKLLNVTNYPYITGEATPTYISDSQYWMDTPENTGYDEATILTPHLIKHIIPDVKVIIILRNPTDRLFSDYNFFGTRSAFSGPGHPFPLKSKYTPSAEDFHNRVVYSTKWLTDCFQTVPRRHCLYDIPYRNREKLPMFYYRGQHGIGFVTRTRMGLYVEYLKDWFEIFPREQILVVRMEDYAKDRKDILDQVFKHLSLPADQTIPQMKIERKNDSRKKVPEMLKETRKILDDFYKPYNKALADLLNDTRYLWDFNM